MNGSPGIFKYAGRSGNYWLNWIGLQSSVRTLKDQLVRRDMATYELRQRQSGDVFIFTPNIKIESQLIFTEQEQEQITSS